MDSGGPRRRKPAHHGKGKARPGSVEWAKKRTRNIERLMRRGTDMPADVRNEMERELTAHKQTIGDKAFQRKRSAMITRYHKVRFFERKKAERLVKQLKRQVDEEQDASKKADLEKELHIAQVDEAYTIHYPHIEDYISLYRAKKGDNEDTEDKDADANKPAAKEVLHAERPQMWSVIEAAMTQGPEALRKIREKRGANDVPERAPASTPHPARAVMIAKGQGDKKPGSGGAPPPSGMNRRERRRLMREAEAKNPGQGEDNDEDGQGFFEL